MFGQAVSSACWLTALRGFNAVRRRNSQLLVDTPDSWPEIAVDGHVLAKLRGVQVPMNFWRVQRTLWNRLRPRSSICFKFRSLRNVVDARRFARLSAPLLEIALFSGYERPASWKVKCSPVPGGLVLCRLAHRSFAIGTGGAIGA